MEREEKTREKRVTSKLHTRLDVSHPTVPERWVLAVSASPSLHVCDDMAECVSSHRSFMLEDESIPGIPNVPQNKKDDIVVDERWQLKILAEEPRLPEK